MVFGKKFGEKWLQSQKVAEIRIFTVPVTINITIDFSFAWFLIFGNEHFLG